MCVCGCVGLEVCEGFLLMCHCMGECVVNVFKCACEGVFVNLCE